MAQNSSLSSMTNPLIAAQDLLVYLQKHESREVANVGLFKVSLLTQVGGLLLRLPQEVVASSIILFQRHVATSSDYHPDNESLNAESDAIVASAACIYLAAKQSLYPLAPRSVVNVYGLLTSSTSSLLGYVNESASAIHVADSTPIKDYYISEGTYQIRRDQLFAKEKQILASLGFNTKVCLPHSLALTYLQALSSTSQTLASRVLAHLNGALLNPQLLYLTHQPSALAVAAIYLAAREVEIPLVDEEVAWWEVFDVGREELGFLVLSMHSLQAFMDHHFKET